MSSEVSRNILNVIFAKWVYQGGSRSGRSGQLLNNAGVAYLNGRIIKVGTYDEIRHWLVTQLQINKAELRATDLRDEHPAALLTPALVNAHTHLELSDTPRPNSPDGSAKLVPWLADMRQRQMAKMEASTESLETLVKKAAEEGVRQCKQFGVGAVGDIARQFEIVRNVLSESGMRGVSYAEVIGLGPRKSVAEAALLKIRNLAEKHQRRCKISLGISPHAPYTLEPGMVKNCVIAAQAMGLPLTMHLAEHPEEQAFMTGHGGELRQLYQQAPLEDWGLERFAGSPIELAKWAGMLTGGKPWAVSVAHGNYLSDLDIRLLNAGTVVYCPRTHAYFGHAAHPLPRLIRAGVRVALGTDSAASSGDLNLLLDGQKVWETFGHSGIVSAGCIWRMMTSQAAHALGLGSQLGQLRRGFVANIAAWNVAETSADILANVLKTAPLPLGLWLDGERVETNQPKSGG